MLAKELRIKGTELRALEGDNLNIEGYVNAVGRESELLFSPKKGKWFKEIMEPGVFKRALQNNVDIPMLLEHDYSKEIARTSNGTLELTEDSIGLKFKATITDEELYSSIKNGEINSCSFGFVCEEEEIEFVSNREEKRYVKDIQLLEVSLVKNPAYIGSLVEARNMETALQELQELGISRKENTVEKANKQESRAYCSYIWDTHDAVNCCLELMACATSLLTYKENSNSEIQALSRDILTKVGAYMAELAGATTEERNLETEEVKEEEVVVEEERNNPEETVEETVEETTEERATEETEEVKEEEEKEPVSEEKEEDSEEKEEDSEEKEEETENRNILSPEDEILLIRAKLSNLK